MRTKDEVRYVIPHSLVLEIYKVQCLATRIAVRLDPRTSSQQRHTNAMSPSYVVSKIHRDTVAGQRLDCFPDPKTVSIDR